MTPVDPSVVAAAFKRPKPQRGRLLFVGIFSSLSFYELKDQKRQSELWESPLIILNDTSENVSDGLTGTETHDLTSEVYMRSLTARFSHLSTPVAK